MFVHYGVNVVITSAHTRTDHLAIAQEYAARPDDWPMAPRFDPVHRWYGRLAEKPDVEVWLLTWLPGQGTDLHDHGGSSGAFVVVSGQLTERIVSTGSGPEAVTQRHRLIDNVLPVGSGRVFGTRHIHQMTNDGNRPAVSVHVYGPPLRTMTRYQVMDGQLRIAVVDRAGQQW